jgi:NADH-quinone oxidoreductase subunit G
VDNPEARVDVGAVWHVDSLPPLPGRDTEGIVDALSEGKLAGALLAGVELADLPDPAAARRALADAEFVLSLEVRHSEVTDLADVVLPVAPAVEKSGTFVNWEGRDRRFSQVLAESNAMTDSRVLSLVADELELALGLGDLEAIRAELAELGRWDGELPPGPAEPVAPPPSLTDGQAVLATWRMLLDDGRLQDGEPHLAGTARAPVARLSATTAAELGATAGGPVTVSTDRGSITLPLEITEMVDQVVWVPQYSPGSHVHDSLGVIAGDVVTVRAGGDV